MLLGAIAAVPSYFGLIVRARTSLDDSLDVVAAHGLGGTVGALLTGVFAEKSINGVFDGALYGNPAQLGIQAMAVGTAIVYSGVVSFVLLKLIGLFMPLRATMVEEVDGLDLTMHGEEAYLHTGGMEAVDAGARDGRPRCARTRAGALNRFSILPTPRVLARGRGAPPRGWCRAARKGSTTRWDL